MVLLFVVMLASGPQMNYCELCHSDVKVQYKSSVHEEEGLTCVSCHGGDASADGMGKAHGSGFRPLTNRLQNPEACASCHADQERMRAYGLPTDQLALYETSIHGRKLKAGDTRVAVCTDCHGVHRIVPPANPDSMTHPRNIANTCGHCHGDQELMSPYGISAVIVSNYKAGIHGKALEQGNLHAPVCTSCHGTHGAAPPGVGDVNIVCGHCHQSERDHFRHSPHSAGMQKAGIGACVACHDNHKTEKADHMLWTTACSSCHEADSIQANTAEQLRTLLKQADTEVTRAREAIQLAAQIPLDVSDYEAGLEEAHTYLEQARPVSHSLNVHEVEDLTRKGRSVALEIQAELHAKQEIFRTRRFGLIVIWFYIVLSVSVAYRLKKQLSKE